MRIKHWKNTLIDLFDPSRQVEEPTPFSLAWAEMFAQVAYRLDQTNIQVEMYASAKKIYLKYPLGKGHSVQFELDEDENKESFINVCFSPTPFDPPFYKDVIEPAFANTKVLCDFTRLSMTLYCHPLTGTREEIVTFLCNVASIVHLVITPK